MLLPKKCERVVLLRFHHNISIFNAALFGILFGILVYTSCTANSTPTAADLVVDNQPIDLSSERYQLLYQELEEQYAFNKNELTQLFSGLKIDRTVLELMDKQWEAKPYYQYWPLFITPSTIFKGKRSLKKYRKLFDRIEAEFGVDREVVVAIWGVESRFGFNQGGFNLFRTLNTLFDMYPRRSDFFVMSLSIFSFSVEPMTSIHSKLTVPMPELLVKPNLCLRVLMNMRWILMVTIDVT